LLFTTTQHITLSMTNVWIIPPGAHTWESANRYAIESPGRRTRTRATRAMCNHSINYVTARSRLFLLRTPKCATRYAMARQTRQSRLHRRGGGWRMVSFFPTSFFPLSSIVLSRSIGTLSRTFLRSVARKRKENIDGISLE